MSSTPLRTALVFLFAMLCGAAPAQTLPVLSPLEQGSYVNFDSPPVKPLAVRGDGRVLLAVNTPSNWLEVFDSSDDSGHLQLLRRIPTGLEPVSVFFEPGGGDRFAWVLNFIGDDITVVDVDLGAVVGVIPVGDEPVNVVFDEGGEFAFVITQGPARATLVAGEVEPRGALSVVRVAERAVIASVQLDCATPRAALYDAESRRVLVGALHSGNGSALVGHPIEFATANGPQFMLTLRLLQTFSVTAALFAQSSLSPWPDVGGVLAPPPLVARIVPAGAPEWEQLIGAFTGPGGAPTPQAIAQFAAQFQCAPSEAERVLIAVRDERAITRDHDIACVSVQDPHAPVVTGFVGGVGTTLAAMDRSPITQRVYVTNMEARNATRLEHALRGRFMRHEVVRMSWPQEDGSVDLLARRDLHESVPNFDDATSVNEQAQARSLANPTDILADPAKPVVYVAALGTDRVAALSAETGEVVSIAEVGRGPRALAIDATGRRLYSYNRTDLSITVMNSAGDSPEVLAETRLMSPEPREVRAGRHFSFTAKLSNNFSSSCAMCHVDSGMDGLAWDLGDSLGTEMLPVPLGPAPLSNHPLKGPMVTQSLRGLRDHEPFHWRGDRPSLNDFAGTFDALLGGQALPAPEMSKLGAYVMSLVYPPNPFYERDNKPISTRISAGFALFDTSCVGCHDRSHDGATRFGGQTLDLGTDLSPLGSQVMEFTQLRGLYKKFFQDRYSGFGMLHDGRQGMGAMNDPLASLTMGAFFGALALDGCPGAHPEADALSLSNCLRAFPSNVMPVVGWQELLAGDMDAAQVAALTSAVMRMRAEHAQSPSRCDVVARGLIGGEPRGFVMLSEGGPAPSAVVFDDDSGGTVSLAGLIASMGPEDRVAFLAVPPGSGRRVGVDMDGDGCVNHLDTFPEISADWNGDQAVDGDDVIAFFAEWDAGDADFTNDGGTDGDDVIAFFAVWDIGC